MIILTRQWAHRIHRKSIITPCIIWFCAVRAFVTVMPAHVDRLMVMNRLQRFRAWSMVNVDVSIIRREWIVNNVKIFIMMHRGDQLKRMILLNVDVSYSIKPDWTPKLSKINPMRSRVDRERVTERIRRFICEIASALVIRSIVDHISARETQIDMWSMLEFTRSK